MKTPLPCFICGDYFIMDLLVDHQHLECDTCHTVWCIVCDPKQFLPENLRKKVAVAHMN